MINLRHLTRRIICRVIPTKWRPYRDHRLCDITPPYVYLTSRSITDCIHYVGRPTARDCRVRQARKLRQYPVNLGCSVHGSLRMPIDRQEYIVSPIGIYCPPCMRSRDYITVRCPSVRLPVCPSSDTTRKRMVEER